MKNNLFSAGYQRERMTAYALQTPTQVSVLKPLCSVLFSVSFLMVNSSQAFAFSIKNQVVAAGGGSATLGSSTLTATIGQAVVGTMLGGGYELTAGFWPEASLVASSVDNQTPTPTSSSVDNQTSTSTSGTILEPVVTYENGTGNTSTTTVVGGRPVTVVETGSTTVTATAPNQNLLATTNPGSNAPSLVVTANQAGAQATASVKNGQTTITLQGNSTITIQPGADIHDVELVLPLATDNTSAQIILKVGDYTLLVEAQPSEATQVRFSLDTVVVNGVSIPLPSPKEGMLSIKSNNACAPMVAVNHTPISAGADNTQLNTVRQDNLISMGLLQGEGLLGVCNNSNVRSTKSTAVVKVLAGETAEFTLQGELQRIRLGSVERKVGVTGDMLVLPNVDGMTVDQPGPILKGVSTRTGQDVETTLFNGLKQHGLKLSDSPTQFGSLYLKMAKQNFNVEPVGLIEVRPNQTSRELLAPQGNGDFELNEGPLSFRVAPTLRDPASFAQFIRSMQGSVKQQADGTYLVMLTDKIFAGQAGYDLRFNQTPTGFGTGSDGYVTWTDDSGQQQTLYPVAADFATLEAEVKKLDSKALLRGNADGSLSMTLNGEHFNLFPDYELLAVAENQKTKAWWFGDDGRLFVYYRGLNKAQGFKIVLP